MAFFTACFKIFKASLALVLPLAERLVSHGVDVVIDKWDLKEGQLNRYLADVNKQAEDMFFRLVKQMAEREGITEQLKAENQMEWVRRMNNIRSSVTEIINYEFVNK